MNALTPVASDLSTSARRYSVTLGNYLDASWPDARSLAWPDLVDMLTSHAAGAKEGACIVPAVFSGLARKKAEAVRIEIAMLDSDSGATLAAITAALRGKGWAGVVSSTHSHLTSTTQVRRSAWERFTGQQGEAASPEAFLLREKGYLPEIARGATLLDQPGEHVLLCHRPCPKFRVVLPLRRPWQAADYPDQDTANGAWKDRMEALAAALGLSHDQSCTDTSRLFYLPRRPADGPQPETAVLVGRPCDIFALPGARMGAPNGVGMRAGRPDDIADYMDPTTGVVFDLRNWALRFGMRFRPAKALGARRLDILLGKAVDGTKHHIRCPNEHQHTESGADHATFVMEPGTGARAGGFVIHCRHGHCDGRDRLFFIRRMLEQGWLTTADLTEPAFLDGEAPSKPRPTIRFVPGEIAQVVDQAEAALIAAELGFYQRGTVIVRPGRVMVTVASGRAISALSAIEVGDHALAEAMTEAAVWEKLDGRSSRWVTINVPPMVAATYRERLGRWSLPVLAGIISAPTLRPDGTVLSAPGYDAATGLLLDIEQDAFPAIPDTCGPDEARAALAQLLNLIGTFPFVAPADRAVALSAILTACIRRSLPTAPLHAFTAPTAGSGKSMLVDLASIIATGREAGVISQGSKEEELEKRLGALLLSGDQVIAIDNCEAPIGGDFLCSMLTQQVVRARILGRSEAPELPANAFVTATGNNLVLAGDMTRRAVLCRLDPKEERPELRRFTSHPLQRAKADRGRLVAAALTVLRAYHLAGRPKQADPLGSFEEWSNWVRGALLWLGQADPTETMEEARMADPKLEALNAVLTHWEAVVGDSTVTVRELIDRATRVRSPESARITVVRAEYAEPDFREALLVVAGDGGVINGKRLGKWLGANHDRIVGGRRIARGGQRDGVQRWQLIGANPMRADAAA